MKKLKPRLRISYLFLLISVTAVAAYFGGPVAYALFYLAVLMLLIAPAYIALLRRCVRVSFHQPDERLVSGTSTALSLWAENTSFLPLPLFDCMVQSDLQGWEQQMKLSFPLPPKSTHTTNIALTFQYRGSYAFTVENGIFSDAFDILRLRKPINCRHLVTVYPHLRPVQSIKRSRILSEYEERYFKRGLEDNGLYSEVREYQPGDSQSRIHWKLSANKDLLMSKLYETSDDDNLLLWLDLNRPLATDSLQQQEKVIELTLSVVHYCLERRLPFSLCYMQDGALVSHDGRDPSDFEPLYTILAGVQFSSAVSLNDVVTHRPAVRETLVFTAMPDQGLQQFLDNPNRRVEAFVVTDDVTRWNLYQPTRALSVFAMSAFDMPARVLEG